MPGRVLWPWVVALAALAGCRGGPSREPAARPASDRIVVVYSSADKEFAQLVFKAYEERTGVKVLPLYDTEETKTAGLTARLVAEKEHPKADVFWSSDTSRAVALVDHQIAAPYASPHAEAIPARYKSPAALWTGFAGALSLLESVGLAGLLARRPGQLSGGEQPRLAIARALAGKPAMLLLDEPFSSVDKETRLSLRDLLREVSPRVSGPTIYVTHDAGDASTLAEGVFTLEDGKLSPDEHPWEGGSSE